MLGAGALVEGREHERCWELVRWKREGNINDAGSWCTGTGNTDVTEGTACSGTGRGLFVGWLLNVPATC